MKMNKRKVVPEEEEFKLGVRAMLNRRCIKNKIPMYIWMRSQKQLAVDANLKRVEKYKREMEMLEELVEEEEARIPEQASEENKNKSGGSDVILGGCMT